MNRATKRLLAKQEAQAERERARSAPLVGGRGKSPRVPIAAEGRKREKREGRIRRWLRFLREVRAELKKVAWPSRGEIFTYTVVVLISVAFVTTFVFVLDFGLGKGILTFFE